MNLVKSSVRIDWIDVAKGMAILMVTAFHANNVLGWARVDTGQSEELHNFLSSCRMPLFFTVSGFFAHSALNGTWHSLWRRRLELYIWLFILWSTLFWLFAKVIPLDNDPTFGADLQDLIKAIVRPIVFIWFLWCLAVFFVFAKLTARVDSRVMLPAVLVISLIGFVIRMMPVQQGVLGFFQGSLAYVNALSYFIFFWAGTRYRDRILSLVPDGIGRVSIALMAFVACRWGSLHVDSLLVRSSLRLLAAFAGVLLLLSVAKGIYRFVPKLGDWFRSVGSRTIPLYVLQIPVMWSVVVALGIRDFDFGHLQSFIHLPLALLAVGIINIIDKAATRLKLSWLFESPRTMAA